MQRALGGGEGGAAPQEGGAGNSPAIDQKNAGIFFVVTLVSGFGNKFLVFKAEGNAG